MFIKLLVNLYGSIKSFTQRQTAPNGGCLSLAGATGIEPAAYGFGDLPNTKLTIIEENKRIKKIRITAT
jgi:hypothetical protein